MVLHAHQQLSAAAEAYRRAHALAPKAFEWLYYLGIVSNDAESLRQALAIRDYLPARVKRAELLLDAGQADAAVKELDGQTHPLALFLLGRARNDARLYEQALEAFPSYGAAMFALAQERRRQGRTGEADRLLSAYPKAKTITPPLEDPLLEQVTALDRGPTSLLRRAMALEAQGELASAAELNRQALDADPTLIQAHINLISANGRLGRFNQAELHHREAIRLNPNAAEAHYNFGVLCFSLGRRTEAETAFRRTVAIDTGNAQAWNNLGVLLQERGQLAAAAKHFEQAIALDPGLRLARFHLGRILVHQGRVEAGIAQLQETVAVDDESTPGYLYALGAAQARARHLAEAAATLERARIAAERRQQPELAAAIARDLARLKP